MGLIDELEENGHRCKKVKFPGSENGDETNEDEEDKMLKFYTDKSGRTYKSTYGDQEYVHEPAPPGWFFTLYGPDDIKRWEKEAAIAAEKSEEIEPLKIEEVGSEQQAVKQTEEELNPILLVKTVDFLVKSNTREHHTDAYEITCPNPDSLDVPQLVLRRGAPFDILVKFDKPFDRDADQVHFVFTFGDYPKKAKNTSVHIPIKRSLRPGQWGARIEEETENYIVVSVHTPPDIFIGKWKFRIDTSMDVRTDGEPKEVKRYIHDQQLYMLFNPWCKDDDVFLDDDVLRDEYIMNEAGKMFIGNFKQVGSKPWNFGQFEDFVLDCCMELLDKSKMTYVTRGNAAKVCKTITAIVYSVNDNGIIDGNWSGNYTKGTAPGSWLGSVGILTEYMKNKAPVRYGQCWAISGLVTTICRALGIPCRSVTGYCSAHDCDGCLSEDVHWNTHGEPLEEENEDATWDFHVWNEVWMTRLDLEHGFGGWQALDATPQETTAGLACAGPSPVQAIKDGHVNIPHDVALFFSEINADKVHWIMEKNGTYTKRLEKYRNGKRISTKKPRLVDLENAKPNPWSIFFKEDVEREDITCNYKYKEGMELERASAYRANQWSAQPGVLHFKEPDVKFEWLQQDDILVGGNFDVVLRMQNKSREVRTVHATVTLSSMYYTGVFKGRVKTQSYDLILQSIKAGVCVMRVSYEQYLHLILDQVSFKISVKAEVEETRQVYVDTDVYRLRRPDIAIEAPEEVPVGVPFPITIRLENSMPIHLNECEWQVEGPGIQRTMRIAQTQLEPYDRKAISVNLTAKRPGDRKIMASFYSRELMDVTGCCDIKIVGD